MTAPALLRTSRGVLLPEGDPYWGVTLHERPNPDAVEMPAWALDAVRLPADFAPIPYAQWGRMLSLFDHVLTFDNAGEQKGDGTTCEAVVILLRGNGQHRPTSEYRMLVPTQAVGGGYTKQNYESGTLIDIVTGERFANLPAAIPGWMHVGDVHSHGRFAAYHSGTDDRSDLRQPGLHMVVGNIPKGGTAEGYDTEQSIVHNGRRYFTAFDPATNGPVRLSRDILVEPGDGPIPFHPNVLEVVTQGAPTWVDSRYQRPMQQAAQGTLWAALTVWVRGGSGVAYETEYDDLDHGAEYHVTRADAEAGVRPWRVGEDSNAAHLRRPTGAFSGRDPLALHGEDYDEAALDALSASYPGLAPFVDYVTDLYGADEAGSILRELDSPAVLDALAEASRGGGLDF